MKIKWHSVEIGSKWKEFYIDHFDAQLLYFYDH